MNKKDLLYYIKPEQQNEQDLHTILAMHPEVQFVSLMGVDFAGNDTDEKIPMKIFLEDTADFLEGSAAQTDGSSVVLPQNIIPMMYLLNLSYLLMLEYVNHYILLSTYQ